ncbi:hypothetical protein OV203_27595 [Nannocystis sp. ILAH1]|uniref:hypothetical protein n=1 Tax=unclassified Nannocystis TaxID=2627009 RepID=UPI00226D5DCC|nr:MULTISPECIES: hypothetical protein [unclassified Nannocystis]MCY0990940.1 hypothetical protein [Nannocystis sp. ILAH1]MCY1064443.1 hypothetical protein [Nannocystis sp. RBIL2]
MNKLVQRIRALLKPARPRSSAPVPAPPVQALADDVGVTVLIYGIYFTMVVFLGAALYVVFAFVIPGTTPTIPACRGDREGECGEGKVCRAGSCVTEPALLECAVGSSCDGCACLQPNSCDGANVCQSPKLDKAACSKESIEFVKDLQAHQAACVSNAGGEMLSSCPASKVEEFLLNHQGFDRLLKEFPRGLLFLYPSNAPPLDILEGDDAQKYLWPDEATKKHYVEEVKKLSKELKSARHIVLVGRASRGGTANKNFAFAQARVRFARQMLIDALAETHIERSEASKKFIEFALGDVRPLQLDFFLSYSYPAVTWSSQSIHDLSKTLEKLGRNQALTQSERREMEDMINRSVAIFVIPTECSEGS